MRNNRTSSNRNTRRENPRQNYGGYGRYNQDTGREDDRRERNRDYNRGYERDNEMDIDREYYNDYMGFREDDSSYDHMRNEYTSDFEDFEGDIHYEDMEERDRDRDWDDYYNGREYDEDYRGVGRRQPGKRNRMTGNTNNMRNRESRPYNEGRWPEARESRFRDNSGYGGRSYGYERYRRDPREDSRDFREYDRYGRNRAFHGGSPGENMREGYFHRDYSDDRRARPNYSFDQESSRRPRRRFRR